MQNLVLAITTFNRVNYLRTLLSSFVEHHDATFSWRVIIADDESTDGTLEYLKELAIPDIDVRIIHNRRQGVHHQFNTIANELRKIDFDLCFKCDDDVAFIKSGWEKLYIDAIRKSGYDHLCYFDPNWRPGKNIEKPVYRESLTGQCLSRDVQGAFFTITPAVIKTIGYMDTRNFGFRGVGHIDYTIRACRAGFNAIDHPFDLTVSNDYIRHQTAAYNSAMNIHLIRSMESDSESVRKYKLIEDTGRLYVDYYENAPSLTREMEYKLLIDRLGALETIRQWYSTHYDHQPKWYVRLGKLLFKSAEKK